jgi:hypothetical protein
MNASSNRQHSGQWKSSSLIKKASAMSPEDIFITTYLVSGFALLAFLIWDAWK